MEFQMEPVSFNVQKATQGTDGVEIVNLETERIRQKYQIINIGDYCNECGNCATFCPTSGAPYRDKAKFHLTQESFESARSGYRFAGNGRLEYKKDDRHAVLLIDGSGYTYEDETIKVNLNPDYSARHAVFKNDAPQAASLRDAALMAILFKTVHGLAPMNLTGD
jgi:putative selenate reductase